MSRARPRYVLPFDGHLNSRSRASDTRNSSTLSEDLPRAAGRGSSGASAPRTRSPCRSRSGPRPAQAAARTAARAWQPRRARGRRVAGQRRGGNARQVSGRTRRVELLPHTVGNGTGRATGRTSHRCIGAPSPGRPTRVVRARTTSRPSPFRSPRHGSRPATTDTGSQPSTAGGVPYSPAHVHPGPPEPVSHVSHVHVSGRAVWRGVEGLTPQLRPPGLQTPEAGTARRARPRSLRGARAPATRLPSRRDRLVG